MSMHDDYPVSWDALIDGATPERRPPEVVQLVSRRENLRNAPQMLRNMADNLEAELRANPDAVCRVVVVVRISGDAPRVHGFGDVEHLAQSFMDLHAGAAELMAMHTPER